MDEKRHLIRFIEKSDSFDNNSKLKAILFVTGVKPNTFIHLRIISHHDKHEFERLLELNKITFKASKAKGYEEITKIKGNAAVWRIKGTWYGYDLFRNKKEKARFEKYVSLVKQQKHENADKLAGSIYGYPECCIKKFIEEHDPKTLPKKYTYYQYYKRLHDSDIAFPFITHTPCSQTCAKSKSLNKKYMAAVKKAAPQFCKEYAKKTAQTIPVVVDLESDIGVWKKKDGHDYSIITQKPIQGKYLLISWLSKAKFKRGTILLTKITTQYDYATIQVKKKTGELKNFHHERKFTKL